MGQGESKVGIGGWLLLAVVSLGLDAAMCALHLLGLIPGLIGGGPSNSDGPFRLPWWHYFDIAGTVIRLLFVVFLIGLIREKRRMAPRLAIVYFAAAALFGVIWFFQARRIPALFVGRFEERQAATLTAASVVVAVLWIAYFSVSKRVKATFVNAGPRRTLRPATRTSRSMSFDEFRCSAAPESSGDLGLEHIACASCGQSFLGKRPENGTCPSCGGAVGGSDSPGEERGDSRTG